MKLTDYSDYALRVLMYLGANPERLVTIQEIADAHGISKNHLTKVAHHLGTADFISTLRGRAGGIQLAQEPRQIRLGAVVRVTEPNFNMVECFDEERNACVLSPVCVLKRVLGKATQAYLKELDRITLADVLRKETATPVVSGHLSNNPRK